MTFDIRRPTPKVTKNGGNMPDETGNNQTNPLQDVLASRYSSAYNSFLESTKSHADDPDTIAQRIAALDPETFKAVVKKLGKSKRGAQSILINNIPVSIPAQTLDKLRASVFNKSLERNFDYNQSRIQEQIETASTGTLEALTGANASQQAAQNLRELFGLKGQKSRKSKVGKSDVRGHSKKVETKKEEEGIKDEGIRIKEEAKTSDIPAPEAHPPLAGTPDLPTSDFPTSDSPSSPFKEEPTQTLKTAPPIPTPIAPAPQPPSSSAPSSSVPPSNSTRGGTVRIPQTTKTGPTGTIRIPRATKGKTVRLPKTSGQTIRTGPTGTLRTGPTGTLRTSSDVQQETEVNQNIQTEKAQAPKLSSSQAPQPPSSSAPQPPAPASETTSTKATANQATKTTAKTSGAVPPPAQPAQTIRDERRKNWSPTQPLRSAAPAAGAVSSEIQPAPQPVQATKPLSQQQYTQIVRQAEKNPEIQELKQAWSVTPVSIQRELLATRHLESPAQKAQGQALQNLVESGVLELETGTNPPSLPPSKRGLPTNISGAQAARARILTILNRTIVNPELQPLTDPSVSAPEVRQQTKETILKALESAKPKKIRVSPTGSAGLSPVARKTKPQAAKNKLGPKIDAQIGPAIELNALQQQLRSDEGISPETAALIGGDTSLSDSRMQGLSDAGFDSPAILGQGITMPEHGALQTPQAPGQISAEEAEPQVAKEGGYLATSDEDRARELAKQQSQARFKQMSYPGLEYSPPGTKRRQAAQPSETQAPSRPSQRAQAAQTPRERFENFSIGLMAQQQAAKKIKAMQAVEKIRANIQAAQKIQRSLQWTWRIVNGAELLAGETGVTLVMWFFTANTQLINKYTFKVPFIPPATLVEDAATIFVDFVLALILLIILATMIIIAAMIIIPVAISLNLLGPGFDFLGMSAVLGF